MTYFNRILRINLLTQIMVILSLALLPLSASYAQAGCCSRHGGVNGCDSSSNHLKCKDGTTSPSCLCNGGTAQPAKTAKTATTASAPVAAPTTTKTTKTTKATTTTKAEKAKTAGCCSRHGGVAKCNKSTGYQMCKDGTQSTTCSCS